ncbi:MAG: glycosyltransferase [Candidatus Margulisiibacteriota bacterium]
MNSSRNILSVCMIVKDGERFLPHTLPALVEGADEVILIDTGSTDDTVELAEHYGAKVFHYKWHNDFAAARNESLKHATCDWIIWVDADEHLKVKDLQKLKKFLSESKEFCHQLLLAECKLLEFNYTASYYRVKVFRNNMGYHFDRPINEQVVDDNKNFIEGPRIPDITIYHWGRRGLTDKEEEKKIQRNINLFTKAIEEHPDDPFYHFLLANNYRMARLIDKAIQEYNRAVELAPKGPLAPRCYAFIAKELFADHKYDEALENAHHAVALDKHEAAAYNVMAEIYLLRNENQKAVSLLEKCLHLGVPKHQLAGILEFEHTGKLYGLLAIAYIELGHIDKAAEFTEKLFEIAPSEPLKDRLLKMRLAGNERRAKTARGKILYVSHGHFWGSTWPYAFIDDYIVRSLEKMGYEVRIYDFFAECSAVHGFYSKDFNEGEITEGKLLRLMEESASRGILQEALLFDPDMIFHIVGRISNHVLYALKKLEIPTAIWFLDDPQELKVTTVVGKRYGHVFTVESMAPEMYNKAGSSAHFLPLGCVPAIHRQIDDLDEKYKSDICFIGVPFPARVKLFDEIADVIKNYNVKIIGGGKNIGGGAADPWLWKRKLSRLDVLGKFIEDIVVTPEEAAKYYNGAKINLNIHRAAEDERFRAGSNLGVIPTGVNGRTFEIAGCCGFQLIDDARPDVGTHFEIGEEIVTFHDAKDLAKKIKYYLDKPEERKKIARRAQQKAYECHTYKHRMEVVLQKVLSNI